MKFALFALVGALSVEAAVIKERATYAVKGKAEGFAAGVTGAGNAACQIPSSKAQLVSWITDNVARCIVIDRKWDLTEGMVSADGCRPTSNKCGSKGQDAINKNNWCQASTAGVGFQKMTVKYDKAALSPLLVGSNKSIIGVGNKGVLYGKGLRIAGKKNIIIQNIHITYLNPSLIWGGDGIAVDAGGDLVWIDHCKFSLMGRQMFVASPGAAGRITLSNNEFDGQTNWSSTCDGRHYYAIYFDSTTVQCTMKNNYIHNTSGRSPKIANSAVVHVVNNYWYSNSGHAFDLGTAKGQVLAEGNYFSQVTTPLLQNKGSLFASTSDSTACKALLGRNCQANKLVSSGPFSGTSTGPIASIKGKACPVTTASTSIANQAGIGKI